jgi:kynurenine 3-monooxygenase
MTAARFAASPVMAEPVAIIGGGLCGNLLAILLARLGFDVTVYERDPAPGAAQSPAGRSINLALAARGIAALERADAYAAIEPLLLPMLGRIVHEPDGRERCLAYGARSDERIWSVSRHELNQKLLDIARGRCKVRYRFDHRCVDFDVDRAVATISSAEGNMEIASRLLLAADGAGSVIRRKLAAAGAVTAEEILLDHGYRELTIPARANGEFALAPDGLHIWPRGGFMLIALPNLDRTFTATLFLPIEGRPGFDSVDASNVCAFFAEHFPDALPLMPALEQEFAAKPVGTLGTVRCEPWSRTAGAADRASVLLIGDAAHAIVPFHGQGMNAAFEDCAELARLVADLGSAWPDVLRAFEAARHENVRAIAEMALENYEEMRDTVRDPAFEHRAALSFELERRFPGRFIPRYSMVMFHPEIGYAEAQRRGRIQAGILDEALTAGDEAAALHRACRLVEQRL